MEYSASRRGMISAEWFTVTPGSIRNTSRWSHINREGSSPSITSDVEANSLARHDRRNNGAIATRHMNCELRSRPVEFENGETVATVERFEDRDSHESCSRSRAAHAKPGPIRDGPAACMPQLGKRA